MLKYFYNKFIMYKRQALILTKVKVNNSILFHLALKLLGKKTISYNLSTESVNLVNWLLAGAS